MLKNIRKSLFRFLCIIYFTFWFSLYLSVPALAYVDPATTAMITQLVAGLFISAGVLFGVFRRKIVLFFRNISVKRAKRKIEKSSRNHLPNGQE